MSDRYKNNKNLLYLVGIICGIFTITISLRFQMYYLLITAIWTPEWCYKLIKNISSKKDSM